MLTNLRMASHIFWQTENEMNKIGAQFFCLSVVAAEVHCNFMFRCIQVGMGYNIILDIYFNQIHHQWCSNFHGHPNGVVCVCILHTYVSLVYDNNIYSTSTSVVANPVCRTNIRSLIDKIKINVERKSARDYSNDYSIHTHPHEKLLHLFWNVVLLKNAILIWTFNRNVFSVCFRCAVFVFSTFVPISAICHNPNGQSI